MEGGGGREAEVKEKGLSMDSTVALISMGADGANTLVINNNYLKH